MLVSLSGIAQIKGNKNIETKTFNIENIQTIKINFYAQVIIDQSKEENLTITTDSNLFDLIDKDIENGVLHLDQKEWIQPSEDAKIVIGAPNIRKVESGTHDTTRVINLDNDYIQVLAPIGNIVLEGRTKELRIASEQAQINATDLIAENARINIWDSGTARVNVINTLDTKINENATLEIISNPKKLKGDTKRIINKKKKQNDNSIRYIKFKIENNSPNRRHFEVVGPKPNGSKFGYGFPMMPLALRKENWTIGTKIYLVNKLGMRRLIKTISKKDEGQVVKLF